MAVSNPTVIIGRKGVKGNLFDASLSDAKRRLEKVEHERGQLLDHLKVAEYLKLNADFVNGKTLLSVDPIRTSSLNSLRKAIEDKRVLNAEHIVNDSDWVHSLSNHFFVITQDLASIIPDTEKVKDDEIPLPFDHCCFQITVNGITSITCIFQEDGKTHAMLYIRVNGQWMAIFEQASQMAPFVFTWRQIVAACIAMEAEVVDTETVQPPAKLNKARQRDGKKPLDTYRVLTIRGRSCGGSGGTGEGPRMRLHFRRGHWRHYATGEKVWIKWCLAGDPALGTVQKHYVVRHNPANR